MRQYAGICIGAMIPALGSGGLNMCASSGARAARTRAVHKYSEFRGDLGAKPGVNRFSHERVRCERVYLFMLRQESIIAHVRTAGMSLRVRAAHAHRISCLLMRIWGALCVCVCVSIVLSTHSAFAVACMFESGLSSAAVQAAISNTIYISDLA